MSGEEFWNKYEDVHHEICSTQLSLDPGESYYIEKDIMVEGDVVKSDNGDLIGVFLNIYYKKELFAQADSVLEFKKEFIIFKKKMK